MTEIEKDLRTKISEILVKWHMPTRQAAISEILNLFLETVRESKPSHRNIALNKEEK